jgi:drug/metabolite transporter (DMT)-like permease
MWCPVKECYGLVTTVGLLAHNAGMDRDVSWQRIAFAVLIGGVVFACTKFAYGFQISLQDIIGFVVGLTVLFGLAALILIFRDKLRLRPNMSAEEREAAISKRPNRLQRGWAIAFVIMASVALPIHVFGFEHEPLWQRLLYSGLAALIVVNFLRSWHRSRNREGSEKDQSGSKASDDGE